MCHCANEALFSNNSLNVAELATISTGPVVTFELLFVHSQIIKDNKE